MYVLIRDKNAIYVVDIETGEIIQSMHPGKAYHKGTSNMVTQAQQKDAEEFWVNGGPKPKKKTGRPPKIEHNEHWRVMFECKCRFPSDYDSIVEATASHCDNLKSDGDKFNFNMRDVKRMLVNEHIRSDLGLGSGAANRKAMVAALKIKQRVYELCLQRLAQKNALTNEHSEYLPDPDWWIVSLT